MNDKIKFMFFSLDTPFKVALIYSNNRGERKRLDAITITDGNEHRSCYEKLKEYTKQYDLFTFVYEPKENRVIFNFTDLDNKEEYRKFGLSLGLLLKSINNDVLRDMARSLDK